MTNFTRPFAKLTHEGALAIINAAVVQAEDNGIPFCISVVDEVCCDALGQTESIIQAAKKDYATVRALVIGIELRGDRLGGGSGIS